MIVIAISVKEAQEFGCPYCGFRSSSGLMSAQGTAIRFCGECDESFVVLAEGVAKSAIGYREDGKEDGKFSYPQLQKHPRHGTPAHGRPDTRPNGGGEHFLVRGIGMDQTPGCFICGGKKGMYSNIAAFVQCKEAGERVVAMFKMGARLDYRDFEPDRVQVKIGACDKHKKNLQCLSEFTIDKIISEEKVAAAIKVT